MKVRFTVTNHSGSMIRQLTLNACCWLAEDRLGGYQVCYERRSEDKPTSPMLPVVIYSPKQQDPDPRTTKKLFDLCINWLSTNSPLIIGSVSSVIIPKFKRVCCMISNTVSGRYSSCNSELYSIKQNPPCGGFSVLLTEQGITVRTSLSASRGLLRPAAEPGPAGRTAPVRPLSRPVMSG